MLALIKWLAMAGGYRIIHLVGTKYIHIDDDVHGRVLCAREAADIIVALQEDVRRLTDELELQRRLNR